jgi:hypothetical protein
MGGILCINQYVCVMKIDIRKSIPLAVQKVCCRVLGLAALIFTPHDSLHYFRNDVMC